jgi:molybdate transport system regulatory protein
VRGRNFGKYAVRQEKAVFPADSAMARLTIRLDFSSGDSIGPGKIGLLEAVAETGSIRKAAAAMKMSFRQAWLLVDAAESSFGAPLVEVRRGGRGGGGAALTELGEAAIAHYRRIERLASEAARVDLETLERRARGRGAVASAGKARLARKTLRKS